MNSQSGKPHIALRAAAGDEAEREQCQRRTERQQRDDAAVESVGVCARGGLARRPEQRRGNQQRGNEKEGLAADEIRPG